MTKTLKDLFEVYKPKSPDEQKFVDKHVTIKHKDRNGNDDDVFKGNTKYIKRKEERHGYDVGDDEKVYEEVEDLDELSKSTIASYVRKNVESPAYPAKGASAQGTKNRIKNLPLAVAKHTANPTGAKVFAREEAELEEKKLTPAEMKKREEIAKAMERENPGMDKSKKMAIATATAKRVAEEAEELDELSNKKMSDYMDKASDARGHRNLSTKKVDNRYKGVAMAAKKMAKEEVEQVDELSKGTLGSYVNKAAERIGTQGVTAGLKIASDENSKKNFKSMGKRQKGIATAVKKLTKEEIIDRAINKYMPELEDYVPMTQEEKLVAKLEHLPEAHILTLLGLYENLNEDNRNKMMIAIDTQEGINSLIDFAIQNNRGE